MGKYRDLLISAKHNNSEAVMELYKRCQPTIKKYSYSFAIFMTGIVSCVIVCSFPKRQKTD